MIIFFLLIFLLFFYCLIEKYTISNNLCCIYAYYEKNEMYRDNLLYFINNGILDNVDYYIIINGKHTIDLSIFNKNNITVLFRENIGFDFGAYSYLIKKLHKTYDYYFFINSSVRGPYASKAGASNNWTDYFLELFYDKDVKIVGTSININPLSAHVQSMFFCITRDYFNYLNSIDFFNEEEINNYSMFELINEKEIKLSKIALDNNWNINCILDKYKNLDYRIIKKDINPTSVNGDPYFKGAYFNNTIDKYEVIFFKNNRFEI